LVTEPKKSPRWNHDEIVIAMAFYIRHEGVIPDKTSSLIHELSNKLRLLAALRGEPPTDKYRNVNGVYMKLMNYRHLDRRFDGVGLSSVSSLDRKLWELYGDDPSTLFDLETSIKSFLESQNIRAKSEPVEREHDEVSHFEGSILEKNHFTRERSKTLVNKKKQRVMRVEGRLACEACGFDFERIYGEHGHGFIECHHLKPMSQLTAETRTNLEDLALLCANCHRMIHFRRPWLTMEELKSKLHGLKGKAELSNSMIDG